MVSKTVISNLFNSNPYLVLELFRDANVIATLRMTALDIYSLESIEAKEEFPVVAVKRMKHMLYLNSLAKEAGAPFITRKLQISADMAEELADAALETIEDVRKELESKKRLRAAK